MIPRPKFRKWHSGRDPRYLEEDKTIIEHPISGGFKGVKVDNPAIKIPDENFTYLKNLFIKNGVIESCFGYGTYGTGIPLDAPIWGVFERKRFEGTRELFAITSKSLYLYSAGAWDYLTDGKDLLTGGNDDVVNYDMTYSETDGDMITIITNYKDYIKKQVAGSEPANLFTNWYAKITKNYEHFQFYGYIKEGGTNYPQKIYWSDIGKPATVTTGMAGGVVLAKSTGFLTGFAPFRGFLGIFKEDSFSVGRYTGSYTWPMEFDENVLDIGTKCGKTICNIGDELIFLANDRNVYITDGSLKKDISKEVRPLLGDKLNIAKIHKAFGKVVFDEKWYLLFVPTTGNSWPYDCWLLNFNDFTWQLLDWQNMMDVGFFYVTSGLTIGGLTETIGNLIWQFGSTMTQPGTTSYLMGDKDGYIYEFSPTIMNKNASAFERYADTKDFEFEKDLIKRFVEFEFEANGSGNIEIWYSTNEGKLWVYSGYVTLSTDYKIFNHVLNTGKGVNSQKIRFRFRNNSLNCYFSIKMFNPKRVNKSSRKENT